MGRSAKGVAWVLNTFWLTTFLVCLGGLIALRIGIINPGDRPDGPEPPKKTAKHEPARGDRPRLEPNVLPVAEKPEEPAQPAAPSEAPAGMIYLEGGAFTMGDDRSPYAAEAPPHQVEVDAFWIDRHEVTNAEFANFVQATGYETTAEQNGWSPVFDHQQQSWFATTGANWKHPDGPGSSLAGRENYPVVHVSWYDAQAYAKWAGKRLPTEAEWEFAARGGLSRQTYPWGERVLVDGKYQANYWQGLFPDRDSGLDGFRGLAPVGSFGKNGYGLVDASGNVWEWCSDWFDESLYQQRVSGGQTVRNPTGPNKGMQRVVRGGSWMCSESLGASYRVYSRMAHDPEATFPHVGFRCAKDVQTRVIASPQPGLLR